MSIKLLSQLDCLALPPRLLDTDLLANEDDRNEVMLGKAMKQSAGAKNPAATANNAAKVLIVVAKFSTSNEVRCSSCSAVVSPLVDTQLQPVTLSLCAQGTRGIVLYTHLCGDRGYEKSLWKVSMILYPGNGTVCNSWCSARGGGGAS